MLLLLSCKISAIEPSFVLSALATIDLSKSIQSTDKALHFSLNLNHCNSA